LKNRRGSKEIQELQLHIPMLRWVSLIIFLQVWYLPTLLNINIFGFIQCKYIWILLVTFPNNRSFGMGYVLVRQAYSTNVAKTILSGCLSSKASSAVVAA